MQQFLKKISVLLSALLLTQVASSAGFVNGICIANGAQFSNLSPLQAVVTDSFKNLISMPYSASTSINSLVSRDSDGFTALDGLKVGEIQSLNPFDPDTRISIGSSIQFNNFVFFPGLDPLKLMATDGTNQVQSLTYTENNSPNTVVFRDSNQSFGINNINVDQSITMSNAAAILSPTGATNNFTMQVYSTADNSYKTFMTGTVSVVPSFRFSQPSGGVLSWNGGAIGNITPSTGAFTILTANTLTKAQGSPINLPSVRLIKTSSQSISDGTFTSVSWDTTPYIDSSSFFSSSNPTRITIPVGFGGTYRVSGSIGPANNDSYPWATRLLLNGSPINLYGSSGFTSINTQVPGVLAGGLIKLNAGDYLEMQIYQASGSSKNYGENNYEGSFFELEWVSN